MSSGYEQTEKLIEVVEFVVKKDLKVSFDLVTNRCAILQLQLGDKYLGLIGCHAPTKSNPDDQAKEIFCQQLAKTYKIVPKRHDTR